MKTKATSTREQALEWWNNLSPYDEQHSLREKYFGNDRMTSSLTGREIEEIWRAETKWEKESHYKDEDLTDSQIESLIKTKSKTIKMKKSELQQIIREEIQHTLKERRNPDIVERSLNLLDKAADNAIKNPTGNIVALGNIIKRYVDDIRKSL